MYVCLRRLSGLLDHLTPLDDIVEKLTNAIDPDAPALMGDGHYIKNGYNAELDKPLCGEFGA